MAYPDSLGQSYTPAIERRPEQVAYRAAVAGGATGDKALDIVRNLFTVSQGERPRSMAEATFAPPEKKPAAMPWLWIGGGVLALVLLTGRR
jgi:hypothetical protein